MISEAGASSTKSMLPWSRVGRVAGEAAACGWFILAGCGGLGLIIKTGPWPPTHGWFAMFSGLAGCPLTAWASRRYLGVALSGRARLGAAALFILAGRLALLLVWPPAN